MDETLDNSYVPRGGYTRVENEILEALAHLQLSGHEWRVLVVLMRKTWGWKKKYDWLARGQLAELTGLDRQNTYRALRKLLKRKLILKVEGKPYGPKLYGVNMRFWEWEMSSKMTTSGKMLASDVVKNDPSMSSMLATIPPEMSSKMTPTKETQTKKEKQKDDMDVGKIEDKTNEIPDSDRGLELAKAARKYVESL